jgi:hypothetical protein
MQPKVPVSRSQLFRRASPAYALFAVVYASCQLLHLLALLLDAAVIIASACQQL